MPEITLIVDDAHGAILVEETQDLKQNAIEHLKAYLGETQEIGCARPLEIIEPIFNSSETEPNDRSVRIAGYYHNALTEGPGRRSSVLFQYCPLKCKGCYVPQLHSKEAGTIVPVKKLAELLLDPQFERDGVTILGGEPFAQATGLSALVKALRSKGCPHITCYSGYTLTSLQVKSADQPAIGEVLGEIDILIDGAYIESMASSAGLWTGSGNQRVIDMRASRKMGQIVLYSVIGTFY